MGINVEGGGVEGRSKGAFVRSNQVNASSSLQRSPSRDKSLEYKLSIVLLIGMPSEIAIIASRTQSSSSINV